jgi:hypothetical protein
MSDLAVWYAKISGTATITVVSELDSTSATTVLLSVSLADTNFVRTALNRSIPSGSSKIDNAHNTYSLFFCGDNSASTYFNSMRIAYTYTTAGD